MKRFFYKVTIVCLIIAICINFIFPHFVFAETLNAEIVISNGTAYLRIGGTTIAQTAMAGPILTYEDATSLAAGYMEYCIKDAIAYLATYDGDNSYYIEARENILNNHRGREDISEDTMGSVLEVAGFYDASWEEAIRYSFLDTKHRSVLDMIERAYQRDSNDENDDFRFRTWCYDHIENEYTISVDDEDLWTYYVATIPNEYFNDAILYYEGTYISQETEVQSQELLSYSGIGDFFEEWLFDTLGTMPYERQLEFLRNLKNKIYPEEQYNGMTLMVI